jgi:hypothetical protein
MYSLVASTLPHYASAIPLRNYYTTVAFEYVSIIFISSTLSIAYHVSSESNQIITFLDYFAALLWFYYDLRLGSIYCSNTNLIKIVGVNILSCGLNSLISYDVQYPVYHSLWHIINSLKAIYVSNLIRQSLDLHIVPYRA